MLCLTFLQTQYVVFLQKDKNIDPNSHSLKIGHNNTTNEPTVFFPEVFARKKLFTRVWSIPKQLFDQKVSGFLLTSTV